MADDQIISISVEAATADFMRILGETEVRVRHSAHAHWAATNRFETLARWSTFTTLIGGFLVSSIAAVPVLFEHYYMANADAINIGLFALGGVVSIISILQAVQRWSERSQANFTAANAYSSLRRELEILRLELPGSAERLPPLLERLRILGEDAPVVPENLWNSAVKTQK
jgi:hypothetical protein